MAIGNRLRSVTGWSLLKAFVALLLMLPSLGAAQTLPPPPVPFNVDAFNVDQVSGLPVVSMGALSIGPADHHGLQLSRQFVGGAYSGWRFMQLPTLTGSTSSPTVAIGGRSVPFTGSVSSYSPVFPDGSTLTYSSGTYTYTGPDGTKVTFNTTSGIGGSLSGTPDLALANQQTYPDGTIWTFNWQSATYINGYNYTCVPPYGCWVTGPTYGTVLRLASITNSVGYQITLTYDSNDGSNPSGAWFRAATARAVNNAVEYCDPSSTTCSFSSTWPQVIYGSSSDGVFLPSTFTDPIGRVTAVTYTGYGVHTIRPPGASLDTVVYDYNGSGLVSAVHVGGSSWGYSYTSTSTTVTDPLSNATTYNFNTSGQVTSVVAGGLTTSYSYCTGGTGCPAGLLQTTTMPEGNYVTSAYDTRGNVTSTTSVAKSGSGTATLTTYASYPSSCSDQRYCNKPTSTTDANGNVTNYNYDTSGSLGTGNLMSVVAPAPSGTNRPITVYSYASKQAYYKNSGGSIVASGLNISLPTQVSTCQTSGTTSGTTTTLPCSSTDERRSTIDYGPQTSGTANNLNAVSGTIARGDGTYSGTTAITYDNYGRPVTTDGPMSGTADTAMIRYNLAGDVIGKIAPDPDETDTSKFPATKYSYDSWGHPYLVEGGTVNSLSDSDWSAFSQVQNSLTEYDSYGRAVRQKSRDNSNNVKQVADTVYDNMGRLQCTRLRMDMSNYGSASDSCSTIQTAGADGPDRVTYYTYDTLGRAYKMTTGYASGAPVDDQTLTFSNNGKLATMKDGESNLTTYEYDGQDRLVKTRYPNTTKGAGTSSTTDYEQVGYDANSNVTSFTTRRGETLSMGYDYLNRLTVKGVPSRSGLSSTYTRSVYYGYDLLGDMTYAKFDSTSGEGISNSYDALGRLTSTTLAMDSTSRTLSYGYDAASNLTQLTYPDSNYINYYRYSSGMFNVAALNATPWLFASRLDAQGRPYALYRWGPAAANWTAYTVNNGFDAISRVSSIAQVFASTSYNTGSTFSYNPANQVTSVSRSNDTFAWNGATAVSRSYTSDGRNQYSAVGGTSFSYDANGNLTSDGTNTYVYDVENRLVNRSGGGTSATMRYDPLGRLYETVGSSSGTTRFLYSGDALIVESDGSGNLLRRYVHALDSDTPLVQFEGSGVTDSARRYLYADERGSIIAITDSAGSVLNYDSYDEQGVPGSTNNAGSYQSRFQYTGQAWIPEMGMYYYKARMYSPTLGRFMQTDPIGYGDGTNMYAYVHNDAINGTDPSGMDEENGCTTGGSGNCIINGHKPASSTCPMFVTCIAVGSGGGGSGSSGPGSGGVPGLCAQWGFQQFCDGSWHMPAEMPAPQSAPESPAEPRCRGFSVSQIRKQLPDKSLFQQAKDGVISYIEGVAWGGTALAAQVGLLGDSAQRSASETNHMLGSAMGQIVTHLGQTGKAVVAVGSKYPLQLVGRVGSGVAVSYIATPYLGIPVTGLAAYGTAFKEAYQHPDVVAAATIVGSFCKP